MFTIIVKDLKAMLRRPVIFVVMFIGIVVGSFSLCVYFTLNSSNKASSYAIVGINNTFEGEMLYCNNSDFNDALAQLEENPELPQIKYASIINYLNEDYDLVGYYNTQENNEEWDRYFLSREQGEGVAIISADAFSEEYDVGDNVKIGGFNKYKVINILDEYKYDPFGFDMRRISIGAETLSGSRIDRTWDKSVNERPDKCVIIPFKTYLDNGYSQGYYHITFTKDLTEEQQEYVRSVLSQYFIDDFTDLTQISDVIETNNHGSVIIYLIAVFCGILNVVVLFEYFLKENKKQYIIYRIMGATDSQIIAIILIELAVYTFLAFSIGVLCSYPFIEYSGLFTYRLKTSVWDYIFLFAILYAIEILVCLRQIRSLLSKSSFTKASIYGNASNRSKSSEEISIGNRSLYLLSYQYNGRNLIRTIAICILAAMMSFCFSYAYSYIFEGYKVKRYADEMFPNDAAVILPYDDVGMDIYLRAEKIDENNNLIGTYNDPHLLELESRLEKFKDNVGTVSDGFSANFTLNNDLCWLYSVNDVFAENAPIKLAKGSWGELCNYNSGDELSVIPCIVSEKFSKTHPYRSEFTEDLTVITGATRVNEDTTNVSSEKYIRNFRVAGVIADDAYLLNAADDTEHTQRCTDLFMKLPDDNNTQEFIYVPEVLFDGKHAYSVFEDYKSYFIFYDDSNSVNDAELEKAVSDFGIVQKLSPLIDEYIKQFRDAGGNIYFVHAIISTALLLMGIGGYSIMQFASNKYTYGIYYSLGMSWTKVIGLIVCTNAINMIIPAIVGAVTGVVLAGKMRVFDLYTKFFAATMGVVLVITVFVLSSLFVFLLMNKLHPQNMLNQNTNSVL